MATKMDLENWLAQALRAAGGSSTLVQVAKRIWEDHEDELRDSGDLFYTWQYDMRWAANRLRRKGIMRDVESSPHGLWQLAEVD